LGFLAREDNGARGARRPRPEDEEEEDEEEVEAPLDAAGTALMVLGPGVVCTSVCTAAMSRLRSLLRRDDPPEAVPLGWSVGLRDAGCCSIDPRPPPVGDVDEGGVDEEEAAGGGDLVAAEVEEEEKAEASFAVFRGASDSPLRRDTPRRLAPPPKDVGESKSSSGALNKRNRQDQ